MGFTGLRGYARTVVAADAPAFSPIGPIVTTQYPSVCLADMLYIAELNHALDYGVLAWLQCALITM